MMYGGYELSVGYIYKRLSDDGPTLDYMAVWYRAVGRLFNAKMRMCGFY